MKLRNPCSRGVGPSWHEIERWPPPHALKIENYVLWLESLCPIMHSLPQEVILVLLSVRGGTKRTTGSQVPTGAAKDQNTTSSPWNELHHFSVVTRMTSSVRRQRGRRDRRLLCWSPLCSSSSAATPWPSSVTSWRTWTPSAQPTRHSSCSTTSWYWSYSIPLKWYSQVVVNASCNICVYMLFSEKYRMLLRHYICCDWSRQGELLISSVVA